MSIQLDITFQIERSACTRIFWQEKIKFSQDRKKTFEVATEMWRKQ